MWDVVEPTRHEAADVLDPARTTLGWLRDTRLCRVRRKRAKRGYTLYSRRTGGQVARLRPTGKGDDLQVLWWRCDAWDSPGAFEPVIMPLDRALDFIASEDFFWINS